jgi:lipoprotein-anchoring transpeptidase ErfK/SrfK
MPTRVMLALVVTTALALAGCGKDKPQAQAPGSSSDPGKPVSVTINAPANGAKSVSTAVEVAVSSVNAASVDVKLAAAGGDTITGQFRPDGKSWLPDHQLDYATAYTATVTAKGEKDKTATATATFTTMDQPKTAFVRSQIGDDQIVGIGAMMVLNFGVQVPDSLKASVQNRLFVTSDPPQEGIWTWFGGDEVHYRPKEFWQPGTKIFMRAATGGLKLSGDTYGNNDLTVQASVVTDKLAVKVDNATKKLTVLINDQPVKVFPVSLGKPATPSFSGTMVVMTRKEVEPFSNDLPPDQGGYNLTVYWDMRLTWSGQYIHAAPWSVKYQGKTNVSHGCINLSTDNAKWLYDRTHIGDPVTVTGTEVHLPYGDGWTDWDKSWEDYVKGSAIPYSN